ncbi:MAG: restriction endonuclease subunit R [Ignavibacteria bacterium RIFOXYB2_FULL_35_12]|nr:MAG: restriction endonuclease subunit R [Ignavibacteria bacterium GWA2_36_19]OGU58623.1 MAG: restriction endonuclease subunit R [Ignavibacteria bacterium GWF2_35_20]OGU80416.1 MAG: restriction endonuclease subunit R [Ignavibacteria bacterium RIFOXYA2_FULL_35_9]OGU87100.1 MAG: restriction endonuclease subunit R [Ignavibacteria bacterium RIFOXYA12_FULL_35_25]OGU92415.1 MAG: restriction endonuclease subunit R [Ignavibacteria bacterium RIFOXYC12_FULL_35_11]OGU95792.1 MAG: restriction endonuclea
MPQSFTEHKTVQQRILDYAQEIGLPGGKVNWQFISQSRAEELRHFDISASLPQERIKSSSLFFKDILTQKLTEFNPKLINPSDIISQLSLLRFDIQGNKDFLDYLRGDKNYFNTDDNREYNLKLIDFEKPSNNIFQITEEYYHHNGRYGNREDVVFLVNGIPLVVIECKNATKDEAIAIGIDQIRRYHNETPEMLIPQQIFSVTEALGFSYGVTWNLNRKNLFNWREHEIGNLELKIKTFFNPNGILRYIKNYIIFAEQNEELNKYILRQHQVKAVEKVIRRSIDETKSRGLIWHTQGSGKTYTMIKAAEILFKLKETDKPTIILLIDRNELEDQMIRNLTSLGLKNIKHADRIVKLRDLLKEDYRGIIISMIHKFNDMPEKVNLGKNIYVLVDEAHRTTSGDLGNYLMAAIPNAAYIGFTGTPIDKTAYGRGTFKTFGIDDPKGYLDKYSISDSIEDGTTVPLYYSLAPNDLLVPEETLEKEFLGLAEAEGISDIDELNKILERAVVTKNFLKGKRRVKKIAKFISEHYRTYVENLGYKAFVVAVDREACALYKKALDENLPAEYSEVVYTGNYNDSEELKKHHITKEDEKRIRKSFCKPDQFPKILIVTEKLLTGFDAPILYAMYLDKPMRDHTLLQAIARVNRPYETEGGKQKPFGFVLDFIGIFDKLEKALAFDSDDVKSVIRDIALLKTLFQNKMEKDTLRYVSLIKGTYDDKDVDILVNHFKDKSKRKEFFKFYKELEMLYEIISPDAFIRPYIDNYKTLTQIYYVVRNAFADRVYVDKEFQRKTAELVKENVDIKILGTGTELVGLDKETIDAIKANKIPENVKVINLIKSIEKIAEKESDDLTLISLKDKAHQIQEDYEDRIISTEEALDKLKGILDGISEKEEKQKQKGLDDLEYFLSEKLTEVGIKNSDETAKKFKTAFNEYPNWNKSEASARELRLKLYGILLDEIDDIDKANALIDHLFNLFIKANEKQ